MRKEYCGDCGIELLVEDRAAHKIKGQFNHYCDTCIKIRRLAHWREYNKLKKLSTNKKCSKCNSLLDWRNKNGLCNGCSKPNGSQHPMWKGGRTILPNGYVSIVVGKDDFFAPMRDRHGTVMEHRLVMAKNLNRCLLHWEVVHHINGIKDDNRIENLQLLPDGKYHLQDAVLKTTLQKLIKRVQYLEKLLIDNRITFRKHSNGYYPKHGIKEN